MIPSWHRLQVFEAYPAEPIRKAWCEWLIRHGIDPARVATQPGWIACDDELYRVHVDAYALNERGEKYANSAGTFAARELLTVQLEGKALPFPLIESDEQRIVVDPTVKRGRVAGDGTYALGELRKQIRETR
jgi:hypothetical protein